MYNIYTFFRCFDNTCRCGGRDSCLNMPCDNVANCYNEKLFEEHDGDFVQRLKSLKRSCDGKPLCGL